MGKNSYEVSVDNRELFAMPGNFSDPNNIEHVNWDKWLPSYYNSYANAATAAGQTPLNEAEWARTYLWNKSIDSASGNFETSRGEWEKEFVPLAQDRYNTLLREYSNLSGDDYIADYSIKDINTLSDRVKSAESQLNFKKDELYKIYVEESKTAGTTALSREEWTPEARVEKPPEYKFEMPSEWQTVEDMAMKDVEGGRPAEFKPEDVLPWEQKLDAIYQPMKDRVKRQQSDTMAMYMPYGGVSGKTAGEDLQVFGDIESNKLSQALGYAEKGHAEALANFSLAQQKLMDIGAFKADAGTFKSKLDATNYWNKINQGWTEKEYNLNKQYATEDWTKNADLAKTLAELYKQPESNFLSDLGKSLMSQGGTLIPYLMTLL